MQILHFLLFNEVWLHCHSVKYKALFGVSVVSVRAPKHTFTHNAHTQQGKIPEICSFQTLWNIDSTLSVPQEEETLSLLALACLQAPGELTSASQYFHAEKNHSWGGKKKTKTVQHQIKRGIRCKCISKPIWQDEKHRSWILKTSPAISKL